MKTFVTIFHTIVALSFDHTVAEMWLSPLNNSCFQSGGFSIETSKRNYIQYNHLLERDLLRLIHIIQRHRNLILLGNKAYLLSSCQIYLAFPLYFNAQRAKKIIFIYFNKNLFVLLQVVNN